MNVSTSAAWTRPPVGIVRVEKEVALALERLYGKSRLKRCVWRENEFVEWTDPEDVEGVEVPSAVLAAVERLVPKRPDFEPVRKLLGGLIAEDQAIEISTTADAGGQVIRIEMHGGPPVVRKPKRGDFLISIGLDWDAPYTDYFFDLRERKGIKIITCCYDLIPVLFPHYCVGDVAQKFKNYFSTMTWGSDGVLCISKNTHKDYKILCEQTGAPARRTAVIPLGDSVPILADAKVSNELLPILERRFILFVSTIERRKNHEVLYRAYRILRERDPGADLPLLVFVGMPGWGVGDLLKDIELDPLIKGLIVQLNHVTDSDLAQLYKKSYFCVYPSLYEGWGLPVAEALTAGKAVVASNRGSLGEVGGDLVRYLDPWAPLEWADAFGELFDNPELVRSSEARVRRDYKSRTWDESASIIHELINQLSLIPDDPVQILYPGYSFNTLVGQAYGSSIRSAGESGFLMYGPYHSLDPGSYSFSVEYSVLSDAGGSAMLELVVVGVDQAIWRGYESWSEHSSGLIARIEFEVHIPVYVDAYELRVVIDASDVSFDKVTKVARHLHCKFA